MASIKRTAEFDTVIAYANEPRLTYEDIREERPSPAIVKRALDDYLDNCRLEKCSINVGYLRALGMTADPALRKDALHKK